MLYFYLTIQIIVMMLSLINVIPFSLGIFLPSMLLTTQISVMFICDYVIFSLSKIINKKETISPIVETKKEIEKKFIPKTNFPKIKTIHHDNISTKSKKRLKNKS